MIRQLTEIMVRTGAAWILWLLCGLSIVSLAVALDRWWVLRRATCDMLRFVPQLRKFLRTGQLDRARQWLANEGSVPAQTALAGLAEVGEGPAAAEEAMAAAMGMHRARLQQRLLFLGTVGNNAPFVGLLGTVIGVVGAFDALGRPLAMNQAMGAVSGLAPERVMGNIAEALVATAVGLIVAIPAVAAFNYLQGRVEAAIGDAETLGHVVLSYLKGPREPVSATISHAQATAHGVSIADLSEVPAE